MPTLASRYGWFGALKHPQLLQQLCGGGAATYGPKPLRRLQARVDRSDSVQVRSVWLVYRLRQCPWSRYTAKIAQFRSVAPPTKRARGGRVTAPVTARAGAVFDGSEPFASGTRAHDQKVASYEPLVPIYEVVKTALVACPIKPKQ